MDNGVYGWVVLGLGFFRRIFELVFFFLELVFDFSFDEKKCKEDVKMFFLNRCNIKSEDIKNIGSNIVKNVKWIEKGKSLWKKYW